MHLEIAADMRCYRQRGRELARVQMTRQQPGRMQCAGGEHHVLGKELAAIGDARALFDLRRVAREDRSKTS